MTEGGANTQTIEALSAAVLSSEAGRRVGWAKHFDSATKLDEALHDLNMATEARDHYRRGLSWLAGAVEFIARHFDPRFAQAMVAELTGSFDVLLDGQEKEQGRMSAASLWSIHKPAMFDDAAREERKNERQRQSERLWRNARESAIRSLAEAAGCRNVSELIDSIAELRTAREAK